MDGISRYPGTKPFASKRSSSFFGRELEIQNLSQKILLNRIVLLHGKVGIGKSSLLQAGIMPYLCERFNCCPIYVKLERYDGSPKLTPISLAKSALRQDNQENFLNAFPIEDQSLWRLCKNKQIQSDKKVKLVLIFDQFENLFSFPPSHIQTFVDQLAELVYVNIPMRYRQIIDQLQNYDQLNSLPYENIEKLLQTIDLHLVLSIRSEELSQLEKISATITNIFTNRFELSGLSLQQAEEAIAEPAYLDHAQYSGRPFDFTNEALDAILSFLSNGCTALINPTYLQIICRHVAEQQKIYSKKLIGRTDLGNLNQLIKRFINNQIKMLLKPDEADMVRLLIEKRLISEEKILMFLGRGQSEELKPRLSERFFS